MGGLPAEAATGPEAIRASDEERDEAVSELREQFAEGRLSRETFMHRMDEALGARSRHDLDGLFTDLPRRRCAGLLAALRALAGGAARQGRDMLAAEKAALSRPPGSPAARPPGGLLGGPPGPAPHGPPTVPGPPAVLFFPPAPGLPGRPGIRYTIGRDSRCDLLIEDTTVSRWHAWLERVAAGWVLTDLGSTNGTRLNGWRLHHPVPIQPGDQVTFGSARFVMRPGRPGAPMPAPGPAGPGQAAPDQGGPDQGGPDPAADQAGPDQPGPGSG